MADGTRLSQLSEALSQLRAENASIRENQTQLSHAQNKQQHLLEEIIQQVASLATSYNTLTQSLTHQPNPTNPNDHEASNPPTSPLNHHNPLFETPTGIQGPHTKGLLVHLLQADSSTSTPEVPLALQPLLTTYADVFREPTSLPPHRSQDHKISQLSVSRPSLMVFWGVSGLSFGGGGDDFRGG
ncbi:unnamed protein product [Ilex paraguariensis]|uniref:Uncharacterized protein n=1 Tax=Ilex paraguariensis TaxID=185542 RepID=A0ABC8V4G0_9AQUA